MEFSTLLELIKALGPVGALITAAGIWLTRSLIPRLQDQADRWQTQAVQMRIEDRTAMALILERSNEQLSKTEQEHRATIRDIGQAHEAAIQQLISSCREDKNDLILALERARDRADHSRETKLPDKPATESGRRPKTT